MPSSKRRRTRISRLAQPPSFDPRPPRIAGLAPDDAYGATVLEALRRAVVEGGGELGETLVYPAGIADPSAVVRRIAAYDQRVGRARGGTRTARGDRRSAGAADAAGARDAWISIGGPPFDAILLADGGDSLRSVAALLTFFDVDPATTRFLGTMRWQADPRVLAEGALQGGWFAAPAPDDLRAFENRFRVGLRAHARSSSPRSPTTPRRSRWWSRAIWAIAASPPAR